MKTILKGATVSLLALSFLPVVASAQSTSAMTVINPNPVCISIPTNLRLGDTDGVRGGYVSFLQNYLMTAGYFNAAYLGTGRFGPITANAVVRFQAANGLPATGYVGPLTRALIQKLSCSSVIVPPTQVLSISYLSPSVAAVGTQVTITGTGFTNSNTITMDGSVIATNVPQNPVPMIACYPYDPNCIANRQSITFTVPSYLQPYCPPGYFCAQMVRQVTPGSYSIAVQNSNGTSNSAILTVAEKTNSMGGVSITGIDAPVSLTIGQQGVWTVKVLSNTNSGNLRYSVVWGDESQTANASIMAPQDSSVQSSATFTHTYRISGTYRPTFTVTDDSGRSNSVSTSILVNPIY